MDALAAEAAPAALSPLVLDLALDPDDAPALWRAPALAAWRQGRRAGTARIETVWQDGAGGALADAGLLHAQTRLGARTATRLEPLLRGGAPPLAAPEPGGELVPVAQFEGTVRRLRGSDGLAELRVACGTLRAAPGARAACRVALCGAGSDAYGLARALAETLRLQVPRLSLAGEAAALAGAVLPPEPLGAATVSRNETAEAALVALTRHLGGVLQHWARLAGPEAGQEPVHQMRVATRRLRSALRLFAAAAACPAIEAAQDGLRTLAGALGAARDWDVFLDGVGQEVARAFPEERAVARMLRAARQQREAEYAALTQALHGPGFRGLCLLLDELAVTRPWQVWAGGDAVAAATLQQDVTRFGQAALDRRLHKVLRAGRGFSRRSIADLHALRIACKGLRYAGELFAPCCPGHATARFMRRLAALQEALGVLNDRATAEALVQRAGRGLAAGLVRGFAAAGEVGARDAAARRWKRFRACAPFWERGSQARA